MNRVQRKRIKGYRLPPNTRCVNRGTRWGNPFKVVSEAGSWVVKDKKHTYGKIFSDKERASQRAVECYREYVDAQIRQKKLDLYELKGKNLACFCSLSAPCHADYLLELLEKNCSAEVGVFGD